MPAESLSLTDTFHTGEHPDLTETRIASEPVYDGSLVHLRRDTVRLPDGARAVREYVDHPGAVMILPILPSWGNSSWNASTVMR